MSMSKKDFIALADALRPVLDDIKPSMLERIEGFCQQQNPLFKVERWRGYLRGECGSGGGKVKAGKVA